VRKTIIALSLILAAGTAGAAGAAGSAAGPQTKNELVQRVLQLWHVEAVGQAMLQAPVADALGQARAVLQGRVPQDRQEAAMKEISEDARKFYEENAPLVNGNAKALTASTVAPILAEKFSEEELRQIIAMLESPVKKKFESLVPQMQKALGDKLAADMRPTIEPKIESLRQRIGMRLRAAVPQ